MPPDAGVADDPGVGLPDAPAGEGEGDELAQPARKDAHSSADARTLGIGAFEREVGPTLTCIESAMDDAYGSTMVVVERTVLSSAIARTVAE